MHNYGGILYFVCTSNYYYQDMYINSIKQKYLNSEPVITFMYFSLHVESQTNNGVLCDSDHSVLRNMTKTACGKWKSIGRELGFTEDELSSIVHEPGQTGEEDYYAAMLRRWLDWAPPNHTLPSIPQLSSALCAVGKERLALDLEEKYCISSSHSRCCVC